MLQRFCIECGSLHHTEAPRCPACQGVRDFKKARLQQPGPMPFSQRIFDAIFGREN